MLMDILWTIQWTLWTILWTVYGHTYGLNIHNLWNRGLYYGHDGLCYGLSMDYTVDCLWTHQWTNNGLHHGLFVDMLMDGL